MAARKDGHISRPEEGKMSWSFRYVGDAKAVTEKVYANQYVPSGLKTMVAATLQEMQERDHAAGVKGNPYYMVESTGHVDALSGGHFEGKIGKVDLELDEGVLATEKPA
jgi:hypothetical protein